MIAAALILLRGAERYRMLSEHVTEVKLKKLFNTFADEDTQSAEMYVELLSLYFGKEEINERIKVLTAGEAEVTKEMEIEATLH
jgi:tRNA isopentenyl-2-thiomethyl-A-37 hydroxylase MiaE